MSVHILHAYFSVLTCEMQYGPLTAICFSFFSRIIVKDISVYNKIKHNEHFEKSTKQSWDA